MRREGDIVQASGPRRDFRPDGGLGGGHYELQGAFARLRRVHCEGHRAIHLGGGVIEHANSGGVTSLSNLIVRFQLHVRVFNMFDKYAKAENLPWCGQGQ